MLRAETRMAAVEASVRGKTKVGTKGSVKSNVRPSLVSRQYPISGKAPKSISVSASPSRGVPGCRVTRLPPLQLIGLAGSGKL